MVNNIKVSIIMPSLNVAKYIQECINSVMNQTMHDIEIICVDAGSTDGTLEVLQEYASKDSRIHIINSPVKSYGYQMNLGIAASTGEYIGIVETDDYIKPDMYATLYELAKVHNVDFIKSDCNVFIDGEKGREVTIRELTPNQDLYNKVIDAQSNLEVFKAYCLNQIGIYKTSFIKEHNILFNETPGAAHQDNGFWFQCFMYAKNIYFLNKAFYMLRRDNPNSSVHNLDKNMYAMCVEYDYIRNLLNDDAQLEKKYAPLCARYRFSNYNFTLRKLSKEAQREFLFKYSEDFLSIKKKNELDKSLYTAIEWKRLQTIINNPLQFYNNSFGIKKIVSMVKTVFLLLKDEGLLFVSKKVYYKIRIIK